MNFKRLARIVLAGAAATMLARPVPLRAQGLEIEALRGGQYLTLGAGAGGGKSQGWMSADIAQAWADGYTGQGAHITIADDFLSGKKLMGTMGPRVRRHTHGQWVFREAKSIAYGARFRRQDIGFGRWIPLHGSRNTVNASFGYFADKGYAVQDISFGRMARSIIDYAANGRAVIVKSAGNDGVAVGAATPDGTVDYLNSALIGAPSAIFVGALSRNGTTAAPATLAPYSNTAGTDPTVQDHFLVVGVESGMTGLSGTSFAAPVISGYSAIVSSKFPAATPTQVANRLLNTARTDTIADFSKTVYGRGEASLSRALAPGAIN